MMRTIIILQILFYLTATLNCSGQVDVFIPKSVCELLKSDTSNNFRGVPDIIVFKYHGEYTGAIGEIFINGEDGETDFSFGPYFYHYTVDRPREGKIKLKKLKGFDDHWLFAERLKFKIINSNELILSNGSKFICVMSYDSEVWKGFFRMEY
ncbi:MAG: hypothetical protein RL092_1576 [Bacteroidota bacterium]|jgi:hypothetical protein